jgi:hypothetical protein
MLLQELLLIEWVIGLGLVTCGCLSSVEDGLEAAGGCEVRGMSCEAVTCGCL